MLFLFLVFTSGNALQKPAAKPAVSAIHDKKQTQLVKAAYAGKLDEVRRLLRFRPLVDINARSEEVLGYTPIEAAVDGRQPQVVKYLIENGANPNQISLGGINPSKSLLMLVASREEAKDEDVKIAQILIDAGADLDFIFNDNKEQGGNDRKAVNFVAGRGANKQKLRELLAPGKKKLL